MQKTQQQAAPRLPAARLLQKQRQVTAPALVTEPAWASLRGLAGTVSSHVLRPWWQQVRKRDSDRARLGSSATRVERDSDQA